jgi:hypothetical protein
MTPRDERFVFGCLGPAICLFLGSFLLLCAWGIWRRAEAKQAEHKVLSAPLTGQLARARPGTEVRFEAELAGSPAPHQLISGLEVSCLAWRRVVTEPPPSSWSFRELLSDHGSRLVDQPGSRRIEDRRGGDPVLVFATSGRSVRLPLENWNAVSFSRLRAADSHPLMALKEPPPPGLPPEAVIQEASLQPDQKYFVIGKVESDQDGQLVLGPSRVQTGPRKFILNQLRLSAEADRRSASNIAATGLSMLAFMGFLLYTARRPRQIS